MNKNWLKKIALSTACALAIPFAVAAQAPAAQTTPAAQPAAQSAPPPTAAPPTQSTSAAPVATAAPGTAAAKPGAVILPAAYTGPAYDNRWEVYGGLSFMNGQAGQILAKRYNMGGIEVMGTYWLGGPRDGFFKRHLGIDADYRFGAGTTPVISPYYNRVVVMQSIYSGGVSFRGPKNRYAAVDFHALAGGTQGIFDYAVNHYPGGSPTASCPNNVVYPQTTNLGLYCNHTAPYGAIGGSIDFNESGKLAIRLSPDMTFEHFGTETREFFQISLGAVYRLGKNK
jgi:hypothetical protein